MKVRKILIILTVMVSVVLVVQSEAVIEDGKIVKFDYSLSVNEQMIETTEGKEPLEYVHGEGTIIPGLEKELVGMDVGETKRVAILPEDAYGLVLPEAIKEVPKENFPTEFEYQVGSVIQLQDPEGNAYPGIVWEVKEESVLVNFNHPLAGQTLVFEVEVVSVKGLGKN